MKTLLALILLFSACRHAKKPETGVWDFSYLHDSDRTLYTFDTAVVTINKNGNIDTAWYFGYEADSVWKAWHKDKRHTHIPIDPYIKRVEDKFLGFDVHNTNRKHWITGRDTVIYFNPPIKAVSIIPVEKTDSDFVIGVSYGPGTKFFYEFKAFAIHDEWIRCIQVHRGEAEIGWDSVYHEKVQYWYNYNLNKK